MPTVEQRLSTLETYFQDALTGGHPRWRAKHTNIPKLSDVATDLGAVTSGSGVFGQLLQRHIEIGVGDTKGLASFDEQNRPFWRTTYTTDYWVLGLADHWQVYYDNTTGNAAVNGRANLTNSIPIDRLMLPGEFTTALFDDDYIQTSSGFRLDFDFAGGEWGGLEKFRVEEGELASFTTEPYDFVKMSDGNFIVANPAIFPALYDQLIHSALLFQTVSSGDGTLLNELAMFSDVGDLKVISNVGTAAPRLVLANQDGSLEASLGAETGLARWDASRNYSLWVGDSAARGADIVGNSETTMKQRDGQTLLGVSADSVSIYGGGIRFAVRSGYSWPVQPEMTAEDNADECRFWYDAENGQLQLWIGVLGKWVIVDTTDV